VPNNVNIPGLPETPRDVAVKLYSYGFTLKRDIGGVWALTFPPGDRSGFREVGFADNDLADGLRRVLRQQEEQRGVLHRYEQFDARWGRIVYGNSAGDTTIAAAGCGPTSLAIVLQYLMNNGSRPRDATYHVPPPETAGYAATHGRVSGHGTAGDPIIRGIRERWPEFDGSRVTLSEAAALLEEGKLIIFLCHGCRGYSRNRPLDRQPDVSYGGHYMVLAGVERSQGPTQIF
jgi:Peptidase_C39 like family